MAIAHATPTVDDTEPCPTCRHVKEPAVRLHEIACAGLASHHVYLDLVIIELQYVLAHRWVDEGTYSAVKSDRPISEVEALAWLDRAHAGEVERRPYDRTVLLDFDWWEGER